MESRSSILLIIRVLPDGDANKRSCAWRIYCHCADYELGKRSAWLEIEMSTSDEETPTNMTIYINNLNEKIKLEGPSLSSFICLSALFFFMFWEVD